jgi:hypothetical protein
MSMEHTVLNLIGEIAESTLLGCLEPNALSFSAAHEGDVPRVRGAIRRALNGQLARFRDPVNRNAFLLGCLDYTANRPEEHLLVGYGFRYGRTTKVESIHHAVGDSGSVGLPRNIAHAMWDYYPQHDENELLIFHNHPLNVLNLLFDNLPLASQTDRVFAEARALNPLQIVRRLLGQGRINFYLGENGFVKEFRWPSVLALLERHQFRDLA